MTTTPTRTTALRGPVVLLFAVVTAVAAGTLYFGQPLVEEIRADLGVSEQAVSITIALTQIGYVVGLLLLVPLGDRVDRRKALGVLLGLLALAQVGVALAPSLVLLDIAVVLVGLTACVAQLTVATAANMAPEQTRGRVVGTVMSGLLLGILLARTVAGWIGEWGGWRAVYFVGAGLVLVTGAAALRVVPRSKPLVTGSYRALLASIGALVRDLPVLRVRAALGFALFGGFSVLWTPLGFLLSAEPYGYSTAVIGSFGLIGAGGAAAAMVAGRITDRFGPVVLTLVTTTVLVLAWAPLLLGGTHLWALIVGILVLDLAAMGLHITNQSEIYALDPAARSRLTAAYMATYFLGGVVGSAVAGLAWTHGGWGAVCAVGAGFGVLAVLLGLLAVRMRRRALSR
ncbi:MFS transporter [Nakamurella sp. YIM 132087]|uniref:MFS transporter n=1 Tax=Nakamurella alba TaxID=2665158 RepID=A0A7K1FQW9_9ACTN|nr:MFS transporter [Nakamurella alba]MTD15759.1 MFS transporter [Nakamurella alba]